MVKTLASSRFTMEFGEATPVSLPIFPLICLHFRLVFPVLDLYMTPRMSAR
ncbi:MAG: hypothetical protein RQ862_08655 [Candidatus Caldarchaeales archaeon]|nr:hypothetical protein [Candidatus Caldarchaeales archaeon]